MSGAGAPIPTVLIGATGRMGLQLLRELPRFPGLALCGAVASENSAAIGRDAAALAGLPGAGLAVSAALPPLLRQARLAIDFSSPAAAPGPLAACVAARVPLLLGTTGLAPELQAPLAAAARSIALLVAANTSLGLNLMLELVRAAAAALPRTFDIEILESHHRDKADAPSGTALALGAAAAAARGAAFDEAAIRAQGGLRGRRLSGEIGFASARGGDVVGEHEVQFLGDGERLILHHSVSDRSVFARGALAAGEWLAGRPPGRYRMSDMFSFKNM